MKENKLRDHHRFTPAAIRRRFELCRYHRIWKQLWQRRVVVARLLAIAVTTILLAFHGKQQLSSVFRGLFGTRPKELNVHENQQPESGPTLSTLRRRPKKRNEPCRLFYDYESMEERDHRKFRFPSVEKRIQLYMGQWYLPPTTTKHCEGSIKYQPIFVNADPLEPRMLIQELLFGAVFPNSNSSETQAAAPPPPDDVPRIFAIEPTVRPARLFFVHPRALTECASAQARQRNRMIFYCRDTNNTLYPNLPAEAEAVPILFQFGDAESTIAPGAVPESLINPQAPPSLWGSPGMPILKKFRNAWNVSQLQYWTRPEHCPAAATNARDGLNRLQPMIWKLNINRHYSKLGDVACNDRPWNQKKSAAVFRGRLTGFFSARRKYEMGLNDKETCLTMPRCRLVWTSQNSALVDAKLTSLNDRVSDVVEGYNITAKEMTMGEMLEYKALVVLEGNDVSSGLKWALLSQSIVLMPPPQYTSWAMEEILEPWIHYVPLKPDLTDTEEQLLWVLKHKSEAARIVKRATLFMLDLIYHPQAKQEEQEIFSKMLQRYARHFVRYDHLEKEIVNRLRLPKR